MKFFVTSDIHSFFDIFHKALIDAGFDENNEEHYLIVCGDYFDRGMQSREVMDYLMKLPRKILIKGNHEDLAEDLIKRRYPYNHDIQNGTVSTVLQFNGVLETDIESFPPMVDKFAEETKEFLSSLVNYFETENYVFVHGWIPTVALTLYEKMEKKSTHYKYMYDWRDATDKEWFEARWLNGIKMAKDGIIDREGKTIVCGHWHCSYGHYVDAPQLLSEFGEDAVWEPYKAEGIIAIDRCTAHTRECNVLVIEDNFITEEITVS